ncbi:hypothetical protein Tco_1089777 [Tanacetum coccineum]
MQAVRRRGIKAVVAGIPKSIDIDVPARIIRALEQETRVMDVEIKQISFGSVEGGLDPVSSVITKTVKCLEASSQHRWFNSEKLVDLNDNNKFKGRLLRIKGFYNFVLLVQLSTAKRRLSTVKLSYYRQYKLLVLPVY